MPDNQQDHHSVHHLQANYHHNYQHHHMQHYNNDVNPNHSSIQQHQLSNSSFFSIASPNLIQPPTQLQAHPMPSAKATNFLASASSPGIANHHLVARFNQHSAALSNGRSVDDLGATGTNQFVSVMQRQQTTQLHDAGAFNPAAFFAFNRGSNLASQHHSDQAISDHQLHHHSQRQGQQDHIHQQQLPQQHQSAVMTTNLFGRSRESSSLSTGSRNVIADQACAGLLKLDDSSVLVGVDQQTLTLNTINDLRQHPRVSACSDSNNFNSKNGHRSSIGNRGIMVPKASPPGTKPTSNGLMNGVASISNDDVHTASGCLSSGNRITMNSKSGSKSKMNGNTRKDKTSNFHANSESPRRTFACPTCGKGFSEKFNMKRHMQIHSQARPKYICNECSKSFAWKDNFIRHKKAAHETSQHE